MNTILKTMILLLCLGAFIGIKAQVSVTATAGTTSGSYTTLNAAFASINAGTHQGMINISITGNTTEPATPVKLLVSGGSSNYTAISIHPTGGNWVINSDPSPTANRGIVELIGAQHVTIDGDDPATAGSQNLTFLMAPTTNVGTSCIRLSSLSTTGTTGASFDTVRNCILTGGRSSAHSRVESMAIGVYGGVNDVDITLPAYGCRSDAFINNTITRCLYGIYMMGQQINQYTASNCNDGFLVMNDTIGSLDTTRSTDYGVYLYAFMYLDTVRPGMKGITVSGCDISNNSVDSLNQNGIYMVINSNAYVYDNNIHDITVMRGGGYVYALYLRMGGLATPYIVNRIYNNRIQNISSGSYDYCIYARQMDMTDTIETYGNVINNITAKNNGWIYGCYNECLGASISHHNVVTNMTGNRTIYGVTVNSNNYERAYSNIVRNLVSLATGLPGDIYGMRGDGLGNNSEIYDNVIDNLTDYSNSIGCTGFFGGGGKIYNNMISNINAKAPAGASLGAVGMSISIAGGEIYNNTIVLDGLDVPTSALNGYSYGILMQKRSTSFRNNIIINNKPSTNAEVIHTYMAPDTSVAIMRNNNYYAATGRVANSIGTFYATLSDWQTATGKDTGSISMNPIFRGAGDYHIDSTATIDTALYRNGFYIPALIDDIDGQGRNNPPCIGADEFNLAPLVSDSVWPGDADKDYKVSNLDLLPIGLAYSSTGTARTIQTIVWQGDAASDWVDTLPGGINYKHADCNGDGIVNADDTLAIVTNFGLTHAKTNRSGSWRSGQPVLNANFIPDTVLAGDTLIISISLGDTSALVSNIYGLAFTFNYDPIIYDSTASGLQFTNSWFGNGSNSISISKDFHTLGQVKAAITGINHTARSGSGEIAYYRGLITTDNINGKDLHYYRNYAYITDITAIDQHGNPIYINAGTDSNEVGYVPNAINEIRSGTRLNIYPNPAMQKVTITADVPMEWIQIIDILGNEVQSRSCHSPAETMDISKLTAGVYFIHATSAHGISVAKLLVTR